MPAARFNSRSLRSRSFSPNAIAQDVYELPKLVAIQNRKYSVNSDFTLQAGYLPIDAFNKGVVAGASFTYYFNDYIGWEILNANKIFNVKTPLKSQLENDFDVDVQGFDKPYLDFLNWSVTTNFIYTPLYSKHLLFNNSLLLSFKNSKF